MVAMPRTILLPALLLASALGTFAQNPTPAPLKPIGAGSQPSLGVATIKPHDPNDPCRGCSGFTTDGSRMTIHNKGISNLIQVAYSINPRQLVGAPEWIFREAFDIVLTTGTPGEPSSAQWQDALQHLLAERFNLKIHHDTRALPVFAIEIAKGGPKIKTSGPDEKPDGDDMRNGQDQTVKLTSASMCDFAIRMQHFADRPVVDHTGLTGRYNFALHYTVDESRTADPNAPPELFTAVQEQLGLKFRPTKAPVDVLVIDHIDRPSEN
jgi:uncharacterized protein (TIGR03435 family)